MPNIEYLLPNIGRTVPPSDPGSGECRDPRGERWGGSAFQGVPDIWPDVHLPAPHRVPAWQHPKMSHSGLSPLWENPAVCSASPGPGGAVFGRLHWPLS